MQDFDVNCLTSFQYMLKHVVQIILYRMVENSTVYCNVLKYNIVFCRVVLYRIIFYYVVSSNVVLCCVVLCCVVLCLMQHPATLPPRQTTASTHNNNV